MTAHEPWWAEWWSAVAAVGWVVAAVSLTPGLDAMPAFAMAVSLAPAWFWYSFSLALAAGQVWALRHDRRVLRLLFAGLMGWWWTFVTLAIVQTVPPTPAIALYGTMAALNWHSVLRVRVRLR